MTSPTPDIAHSRLQLAALASSLIGLVAALIAYFIALSGDHDDLGDTIMAWLGVLTLVPLVGIIALASSAWFLVGSAVPRIYRPKALVIFGLGVVAGTIFGVVLGIVATHVLGSGWWFFVSLVGVAVPSLAERFFIDRGPPLKASLDDPLGPVSEEEMRQQG